MKNIKTLILKSIISFSLLFNTISCTTVHKNINKNVKLQGKIAQTINDGMYDNHNAFVDESKFSLEKVMESIDKVIYTVQYKISYECLDGKIVSKTKRFLSQGSGVVIEEKEGNYYIITNCHIINRSEPKFTPSEPYKWVKIEKILDDLYVIQQNGLEFQKIKAEKVACDFNLDLTLLRVKGNNKVKKFPYNIGNSDNLKTGDFIWAIGNPQGLEDYTLSGNVSKPDIADNWFMISSDIQPGYSGGAVIAIRDGEYELVGLVVKVMTNIIRYQDGQFNIPMGGYGFAIKINPIMKMVEDYFKNNKKPNIQ